ncbi:MAG TPA: hypothetical protein VM299_05765 [Solirubrobacteraceae bacterium]|jgi:hypothetical protein|nr:hypothetical protein [Solirubrobacteraceae bacterium]
MTRKSIVTTRDAVACDVCGRTLLRGERADPFIANGSRRMVCELCTARAANEGWIREGGDNALGVRRRNGSRGGRSLLERLMPRREGARPVVVPARRAPSTNVARVQSAAAARPEQPVAAGDEADGSQLGEPQQPAAEAALPSPREPRHVRAVPTNADLKMARALDVFNKSEHPRRTAGVARSLGVPSVTVVPSETEGAIVSIVVAWELCWYRYEVDLADEAAGVRVVGQGAELSELSPAEQAPNATADDRGRLELPG